MSDEKASPEKNKIQVQIDADLEDIVPVFLENRQKDIGVLKEALEQEDFEKIQTLGHGMKGAGAGYGFDEVTEIGRRLEDAAKQKDAGTIRAQIHALAEYLDRIEIVYSEAGS